MGRSSAPGRDRISTLVYYRLPAASELLAPLLNGILSTGHMPMGMLELDLIPLGGNGKDRPMLTNLRPITLLIAPLKPSKRFRRLD